MLDVPNFFWDAEPTLHPLYVAIREYLEIDHRIKVLNERCRVFLDLAEILSDSVADSKMSHITWIIIILIAVSIVVTVTEVFLRFAILEKSKREGGAGGTSVNLTGVRALGVEGVDFGQGRPTVKVLGAGQGDERERAMDDVRRLLDGMTVEEVRRWRAVLSEEQMEGICGGYHSELKEL